jgi:hypothetical protein
VARPLCEGRQIGELAVADDSRVRLKKFEASVWRDVRMVTLCECRSLHVGAGGYTGVGVGVVEVNASRNGRRHAKVSRWLGRAD